jgi:flotillin
MSKEKVEFNLPVVFTVGPISPLEDEHGFQTYAQMLNELSPDQIENIIRGVIEGETRGLTADMTIEEMFNSKERFKTEVVSKIDTDLSKLGLRVLNANIKEMSDYDEDNKYFAYRKKRAIETANYDAQVEVAEARKKGEIGVKEREKDTRVTVAQLDTEATLAENERAAGLCFVVFF